MSSSPIMALSSSFTIFIISFFLSIFAGYAIRVPLQYPLDAPKQVSRPIKNITRPGYAGYYHYVASLYPFGPYQYWQGECFSENYAYLTYTQDFGLGSIFITASNGKSWYCKDYYQFYVRGDLLTTDSIFFSTMPHQTVFDSDNSGLRQQIREYGLAVFVYSSDDQLNVQKELEENIEEHPQPIRVSGEMSGTESVHAEKEKADAEVFNH